MNMGCWCAKVTMREYISLGMTAQICDSLICPALQISSISFGSVCCRSLSTSTYDESVLVCGETGGIEGSGCALAALVGLRRPSLGGTASIVFLRVDILG